MRKSIKRFVYLIYYIKQLDFPKFRKFLAFATTKSDSSKTTILFDAFISVFKYNIGLMDYFYFRFYEKDKQERSKWAGTGYMYEYHLIMNPKNSRHLLENKIEFLNSYSEFVKRSFADIETIRSNPDIASRLLKSSTGKIVLKLSNGQVGKEVKVYDTKSFSKESLIDEMKKKNFDLAEEYVIQHPSLMALSATGLNTVRIFTQLE